MIKFKQTQLYNDNGTHRITRQRGHAQPTYHWRSRSADAVRRERAVQVVVVVFASRQLRDPVERLFHHGRDDVDARARRVPVVGHELVADVRRLHRSPAAAAAAQQAGEAPAELGVEGVDDGVERRVAPADPHEHVERGVADARLATAERNHAVEHEERQPAAHEHAHDHGQRL